ncbi:hypothetical protein BBR47_35570 [Brevibacillus brevis NBRC 100599]|uniref:Uncharacterized protein n=1 Tax=Brevibacillus brevis (strain 47 / JCM 6285 / NBRC 100599) TaxID=358681 RepID=C0ZFH5_BREBN|nr:hypothetical protein [Brevibacillus brevis]BAH44534.1 hypothetical protein BBR47_35570 [Brevibacillus brevis NBRC 100599]
MTEVEVILNKEQRFLIEDPDSVAVIIVDKVTILPVANQVVYSGYSFDVNYEKMEFTNRRKVQMVMNTKLETFFGEDD